jgi:peptide-methionine (S)-S-oxide reductase
MKTLFHLTRVLRLLAATLLMSSNFVMNAAPDSTNATPSKTELATFGGGCFWCVEAVFEALDGVKSAVSGYAGSPKENPTYEEVCTGRTGHAEVVQVEFDPAKISFEKLLDIFWQAHDPTTLNRQGADVGTQYRSIVLYHSDEQKRIAETAKKVAEKQYKAPITTEITALEKFYPAEKYHQDYFARNPSQGYCSAVIRPKLMKLEKLNIIPARK